METTDPIKVCFVFASHGIGGAERTMLKIARFAHPHLLNCSVIHSGLAENPDLGAAVEEVGVPFFRVGAFDLHGLAKAFKGIRPDIVYLFGHIRTIPWAATARLAGVRTLIGAERSSAARIVDWISRKLDSSLLSAYISNSQCAARSLTEWIGVSADRVFVVYNGIEESIFYKAKTTEGNLGDPSIVCVANLLPNKGQLVLLKAIKSLRTSYPGIRAVLIGRDFTEGYFFNEASALGLEDTYTWVGFLPDVRAYLSEADVFVLPTLTREGIPTSVLEAMLTQVPVIASEVGGVRELVKDGITGLLVKPGDPVELAKKIQNILDDDELRVKLIKQARRHVLEHHTIRSMVQNHIDIFRSLLRDKLKNQPRKLVSAQEA